MLCYYQIRNIRLICKYINDERYKALDEAFIISLLGYGNVLLYNIPLTPTVNIQLCLISGDTHWQSFVPAPLAPCTLYRIMFHTFKILSGSDPKVYTTGTNVIPVLFSFDAKTVE